MYICVIIINKQTNKQMNTAKIKEVIKNDEIAQKEIAITLIFIEMERLKAKGFSNELSLKLATINANQKFNFLFK